MGDVILSSICTAIAIAILLYGDWNPVAAFPVAVAANCVLARYVGRIEWR